MSSTDMWSFAALLSYTSYKALTSGHAGHTTNAYLSTLMRPGFGVLTGKALCY